MAAVLSGVRRSRAEWRSLIERAQRSPLSVTAFCAAQGVSTASFYLWRKRLGADIEPAAPVVASFLDLGELEAHAGAGAGAGADRASGWELELALGEGLVLRLRRR
jgi:putative transposase